MVAPILLTEKGTYQAISQITANGKLNFPVGPGTFADKFSLYFNRTAGIAL